MNPHTLPQAAEDPSAPEEDEGYEPRYPASQMDAALHADLLAGPTSPIAIEACRDLLQHLFSKPTGTREPEKVTSTKLRAFGAIVADLLARDPNDHGGWLYRSTASGSFTGGTVGYRPFISVYAAITEAGMIDCVNGFRVWTSSVLAASGRVPAGQRASRFRATPAFREWFAARGIDRASWPEHFARDRSARAATKGRCPVVLRAEKPPYRFRVRKGRNLPINPSAPEVSALIDRMARINDYLSRQEVSPFGPVFLRRVFSCGDDPHHGWRQGGRLYAIGGDTYQTAKKVLRSDITINGANTVELDIQASHLTILAGLGHVPEFSDDPYTIDGLPRPIVKKWVQMTLSHGKRHVRWPADAVSDLMKGHGIDVKADYPLGRTGDAILRYLPILKDDGTAAVPVGWGELQYRESEVMLSAVEALVFSHDIPALPIHDSLIVPEEAEEVAKLVLGKSFHDAFGVDAVIG